MRFLTKDEMPDKGKLTRKQKRLQKQNRALHPKKKSQAPVVKLRKKAESRET